MPHLNGPEVRTRAAEHAAARTPRGRVSTTTSSRDGREHFEWLSRRSGIPVGTIHNVTRDHNPDPVSEPRLWRFAAILKRKGESLQAAAKAIRGDDQTPPAEPGDQPASPSRPAERPRDPSSPPPGRKKDVRGPRREQMEAAS